MKGTCNYAFPYRPWTIFFFLFFFFLKKKKKKKTFFLNKISKMSHSERLPSAKGLFSYFVIYITAIKNMKESQTNCSTCMVLLCFLLKVVEKAETDHVKRV